MTEVNKRIELKEEDLEKVTGGKDDRIPHPRKGEREETTPAVTKIYDSNMADSYTNPLFAWETVKNGYCKHCECNRDLLFSWRDSVNGKSCNVWVCCTCNGENFYSQSVGELM